MTRRKEEVARSWGYRHRGVRRGASHCNLDRRSREGVHCRGFRGSVASQLWGTICNASLSRLPNEGGLRLVRGEDTEVGDGANDDERALGDQWNADAGDETRALVTMRSSEEELSEGSADERWAIRIWAKASLLQGLPLSKSGLWTRGSGSTDLDRLSRSAGGWGVLRRRERHGWQEGQGWLVGDEGTATRDELRRLRACSFWTRGDGRRVGWYEPC